MEANRYGHVISAVQGRPWAIQREKLETIVDVLEMRARGVSFSPEEIQARIGTPVTPKAYQIDTFLTAEEISANLALKDDAPTAASAARSRGRQGAIQVLPLYGVICQRANLMTQYSGGTSTQVFGQQLAEALDDEGVKAIVIDVDSPGGEVFGIQELAAQIYNARGRKPMVSVVNSLCASGAQWLASMFDEINITPGGLAGSIGVYMVHVDFSVNNELSGIKPTYISAGKYKVEGNSDTPLTQEAQDFRQSTVNDYYDAFVADVARGRGRSVEEVRNGFGEGRVLTAKNAVKVGLADRVQTFEQVLGRLGATAGKEVRTPAPTPPPTPPGSAKADRLLELQFAAQEA